MAAKRQPSPKRMQTSSLFARQGSIRAFFAFFLHKSFLSRLHPVLYSCTEKAAPVQKGYNQRAFSREVGMCVSGWKLQTLQFSQPSMKVTGG